MQFGTFRESRWSITFQDAYNDTVHTLLRDWAFMGGSIVAGLVLAAWVNSIMNAA